MNEVLTNFYFSASLYSLCLIFKKSRHVSSASPPNPAITASRTTFKAESGSEDTTKKTAAKAPIITSSKTPR